MPRLHQVQHQDYSLRKWKYYIWDSMLWAQWMSHKTFAVALTHLHEQETLDNKWLFCI